jgi:serine protease Do
MRMPTAVSILLLLLCIVPPLSFGKDAEEIFAEAARYTVRIDVTISTPFIEDQQGAHLGAGFVVDKDRKWVMTNAHVAGYSPSTLKAVFKDGRRAEARKVYVDPYIDVAIIQLLGDLPSLSAASLACKGEPGIGHAVGAFGHPWGLNFTGTQGVVSGRTTLWGAELLQTDTPINGGNSGGPLISMKTARIVGINSSTYSGENDQNTNFAVPISQACRILSLLKENRDPSPPELGTAFYRLSGNSGPLTVARTFLDNDLLQLREDDEVLAVNGRPVSTESELVHELRGSLDSVHLSISRHNDVMELIGRLNPRPSVAERRGLQFAGVLFAYGGYRDNKVLETGHDVMVHSIEPGSAAAGEDLWRKDIVARVNGVPVQDLAHLTELLSIHPASGKVQVDFLRLIEDSGTGHLFYSLRRHFDWSEPRLLGHWGRLVSESLQSRE